MGGMRDGTVNGMGLVKETGNGWNSGFKGQVMEWEKEGRNIARRNCFLSRFIKFTF